MESRVKKMCILVLIVCAFICGGQESLKAYPTQCFNGVTRKEQEQSNWCWAACAQMIGCYLSTGKEQSLIVKEVKGSLVNEAATDAEVKSAIKYSLGSGYTVNCVSALSYSQIQSYIATGVPICAKISWNSGGNHAVVFSGYTYNSKIRVIDPGIGASTADYSYSSLVSSVSLQTGTGKYIATWTVD